MYQATFLLSLAISAAGTLPLQGPVSRPGPTKPAAQGLPPVSIAVIDAKTRQPIRAFSYQYRIHSVDGRPDMVQDKWQAHQSDTGTLALPAPAGGTITFTAKAPEYEPRYGRVDQTLQLKAEDRERKFYVWLYQGITVRGTVRDAATKAPLRGATVSPLVFAAPATVPARWRAVQTNEKGQFVVPGVDKLFGIRVTHPGYFDDRMKFLEEGQGRADFEDVEILLGQGETVIGKVTARDGKPLVGVLVVGSGASTLTDSKGTFTLKNARRSASEPYSFYVGKAGFIEQRLEPTKLGAEGLVVVLEPVYELRGRVVNRGGQAVKDFTIKAGPGRNPAGSDCSVTHGNGTFRLSLASPGLHWVGVRADGFAAWEGWTKVSQEQSELTITLSPGVSVSGKVNLPAGVVGRIHATLCPQRAETRSIGFGGTPARTLATLRCDLSDDGRFDFPHVRPDDYVLTIGGRGITEFTRALKVLDAGVKGLAIDVRGTGQIVGRVFHPPDRGNGTWAFAKGEVFRAEDDRRFGEPMHFRTNKEGRFSLDGIPLGDIDALISYRASADVVEAHVRRARIIAGQATTVNFFDPAMQESLAIEFIVGDGSKAQFAIGTGLAAARKVGNVTDREPQLHIELTPLEQRPCSVPEASWHVIKRHDNARVMLPDISDGKYRLRIGDWPGNICSHGLLYVTTITVGPNQRAARVPLSAGSITGSIRRAVPEYSSVTVIAIGAGGKVQRSTQCDDEGNFCLRYLPADAWTIYAHEHKGGWCRVGVAAVNNETRDVGEHRTIPGGSIIGKIDLGNESRLPDSVVARDAAGFEVSDLSFSDGQPNEYAIANLWPGRWTVQLLSGETVLATTPVELKGTETVHTDLVVRPARN